MARPLFTLILLISVLLVANAQRMCPPNQEWTWCGTACPATCAIPTGPACTKQCFMGCRCKRGFVRPRKGSRNCIPLSMCRKMPPG